MGSDYLFRRNKSSTPVTTTQKTVTVAELSCLTFSLTFERRPTYYLLNVIFPSVLINLLCLFNFIIPCETGEKVCVHDVRLSSFGEQCNQYVNYENEFIKIAYKKRCRKRNRKICLINGV